VWRCIADVEVWLEVLVAYALRYGEQTPLGKGTAEASSEWWIG
jgi:hypothetical protein